MSTPTQVPTPADLATRAASRRLSEWLAPAGRIEDGEAFRLLFERCIRLCGMTPRTRHLALTLATFADLQTGVIADADQPFLDGMAKATGLHRGQVVVALQILEQRGWVVRRISGPERYEKAHLQLRIPAHALARLRR